MRLLWFLPLAFVAGSHGFALFVPYLFLCLAAFQPGVLFRDVQVNGHPLAHQPSAGTAVTTAAARESFLRIMGFLFHFFGVLFGQKF